MRLAVIGATGFIGRHVVRALRTAGHDWIGIGHQSQLHEPELLAADFLNPRTYELAIASADVIILLFSASRPGSPANTLTQEVERNVLAHSRFVELLETSKVRHVVYVSSGGTVYGQQRSPGPIDETHTTNPISLYGVGKLLVEEVLRLGLARIGLRLTVLRPANPIGVGQLQSKVGVIAGAVRAIKAGEPLQVWGDGYNVRDFFDVEDLAEAIVLAAMAPGGGVFNVGSGVGLTIREAIGLVERVADRSLAVEYLPARTSDVRSNVLSFARINAQLGWSPRRPLDSSIGAMLAAND